MRPFKIGQIWKHIKRFPSSETFPKKESEAFVIFVIREFRARSLDQLDAACISNRMFSDYQTHLAQNFYSFCGMWHVSHACR